MKIALTALFFFSLILNGYAQDDQNKIGLHSISVSPIGTYFGDRDGGFSLNVDVAFNSGNHIFKAYAGRGEQYKLNVLGEVPRDSFDEYNIMYGQELQIKKWFYIDFFTGLGFFNFKYDDNSSTKNRTGVLGFPIQSKIRFNMSNSFALGLQLHGNFNSATSIYQPGLFIQWRL